MYCSPYLGKIGLVLKIHQPHYVEDPNSDRLIPRKAETYTMKWSPEDKWSRFFDITTRLPRRLLKRVKIKKK